METDTEGPGQAAGRLPLAILSALIIVAVSALFFFRPAVGKDDDGKKNDAKPGPSQSAKPSASPAAPGAVPAEYAKWIRRASANCRSLKPELLASQLYQESKLDPNAQSPEGGAGLALMSLQTWRLYARDYDGNGKARRKDPGDSIMALGRVMCALTLRASRTGWPTANVKIALAAYRDGWDTIAPTRGVPTDPETKAYVKAVSKGARDKVPALPEG